jgi:hypothetical protein
MIVLPPDASAQRSFLRAVNELGEHFAFRDLIGYVERWREKQLRIETDRMPVDMTGYAIALRDCDLICTLSGLSEIQRRTTQLHEIGHLVMGHIPYLSHGPTTPSYPVFVRRRDRHRHVLSRQRFFDSYADPRERSAESFARLCLHAILIHERSVPQVIIDIYGG